MPCPDRRFSKLVLYPIASRSQRRECLVEPQQFNRDLSNRSILAPKEHHVRFYFHTQTNARNTDTEGVEYAAYADA